MRVQRVVLPDSERESWTVLGDGGVPVEPVERFLAYLASIERSPNTVKAYAHDLKDWFTFLSSTGKRWEAATLEDVAMFVSWLRLAPVTRTAAVTVLPSVATYCTEASVNRKLAALTSFCEFHTRNGARLAGLLVQTHAAGRDRSYSTTSFRPFLHHVTKGGEQRRRTIKLTVAAQHPRILTTVQAQAILDACSHLRDRLLFAVLLDTGVRIGEALGLRHEDVAIAERELSVVPRRNDNKARVKGGRPRTIPTSGELMRLYADYLTAEYGSLDSDYVFVNLWGRPYGHPMTYAAVYDLVGRLRAATGVAFGPHHFRHTYATWLLRQGAGMESVQQLLGHASVTTTIDTYGHLTVEDARRALHTAGWLTGREVRL